MIFNRTFLFVPANHAHRVAKALAADVDAVILDLEDAVAESEKAAARALIRETLRIPRGTRAYVRCNAIDTRHFYADVMAIVQPGLDGIVLPMLQRPNDLDIVDWIITQLERERGLAEGSIDLIPIIETAAGMACVESIATTASRSARVKRLALGAGDLLLDLGLSLTSHELELLPHRSRLSVASRSAGREAPLDTVFGNVRDSAIVPRSSISFLPGIWGMSVRQLIGPIVKHHVGLVMLKEVAAAPWGQQLDAPFRSPQVESRFGQFSQITGKMASATSTDR